MKRNSVTKTSNLHYVSFLTQLINKGLPLKKFVKRAILGKNDVLRAVRITFLVRRQLARAAKVRAIIKTKINGKSTNSLNPKSVFIDIRVDSSLSMVSASSKICIKPVEGGRYIIIEDTYNKITYKISFLSCNSLFIRFTDITQKLKELPFNK